MTAAELPPLTAEQEAHRERFRTERGTWSDAWEAILRLDPAFLDAYRAFSMAPWDHGPLAPEVKEFIYLAMDAAATHMYAPGVGQHLAVAYRLGATTAELMAVLEIASTLGLHGADVGFEVLGEVLAERGEPVPPAADDDARATVEAARGPWRPAWDTAHRFAPEFLAASATFAGVPVRGGVLEPAVAELVRLAVAAAATHLHRPAVQEHVRRALDLGATPEEVAEVLSIVAVVGIHGATSAAPLLLAESRIRHPGGSDD